MHSAAEFGVWSLLLTGDPASALPDAPAAPWAPAGIVLSKKQEAAQELAACGTGVRLIYKYIGLSASWQAPINSYQLPTAWLIPGLDV